MKMETFYGRVVNVRIHKFYIFFDLLYKAQKLPFLATKDTENPLKYGDILFIRANEHINNNGTKIYKVENYDIVIRPKKILPRKQHLYNYEQQYLNALSGNRMVETIRLRSSIFSIIRDFFGARGFLEIETPILQNQLGSSSANPVVTRSLKNKKEYYLKRSGELQQKQIVMVTMSDVYEISKVFRDQGQTRTTMVEYSMLDFYKVGADYTYGMTLTEQLLKVIVENLGNFTKYNNIKFPLPKIKLSNMVQDILNIDLESNEIDFEHVNAALRNHGLSVDCSYDKAQLIELVFGAIIKRNTTSPVIYYDFPRKYCPLGKPKDNEYAEEFKLVIDGVSIGHGYTELTDNDLQRKVLTQQYLARIESGKEAYLEEDYLNSMLYGLPPMTGVGIGLDRLIATLLGYRNIRQTKAFPFY
jgi:Lysyl-tRNA synthetase (class II)